MTHPSLSRSVELAYPYVSGELGSLGAAEMMLLRQHQFPHRYDPRDKVLSIDHDRIDITHSQPCFQKHTGTGDLGFALWLTSASHQKVMAFLVEVTQADRQLPGLEWTGYRVLGTIKIGQGGPVWSLQLFSKHPESVTPVYSGQRAPNVRKAISDRIREFKKPVRRINIFGRYGEGQ